MHRYKDVNEVQGNTPRVNNERKYLDALCVFRNAYRMSYNDQSLFKVFFTIRKDNEIIAATSPFTGFYLKEDNIQTVVYDGKIYFSQDEFDQVTGNLLWVPLNQRGRDFQEFMYKLVDYLINNVGGSFVKRYKALQDYVNNQLPNAAVLWNGRDFASTYLEFDFAGISNCSWGFPIFTNNPIWNGHNVHVIPNSFDCSFLRYMLVPQENATFELNKNDYNPQINQRRNPINGQPMEWVSVDDFLADRVMVIQGEINNEKYFAIEDQNHCCNVIPPLTDRFFEFFKVEDLRGNGMGRVKMSLHSEFYTDCPMCIVTLDVPYRNAGNGISYLTLSKTYTGFDQCVMNVNIELGIFPFIKTPNNVDDFYRIALYANKDLKLSNLDIVQLNNDGYYSNGCTILADDGQYIRRRFTNGNVALSTALQTDLLYYSLESTFNAATGLMNHRDVSFDLLKIKYCIDRPVGREDCEAIIVPFMEEVPQGNANVRIAIDFGTSNTFVAYNTSGNAQGTKDFETTQSPHCGDTLFVKFAKLVDNPNLKERFDFANNRLTQRCEFLPAYFNTGNGFKFPVPSILNVKNTPDATLINYAQGDAVSILDANIPFRHYRRVVLFRRRGWCGCRRCDRGGLLSRAEKTAEETAFPLLLRSLRSGRCDLLPLGSDGHCFSVAGYGLVGEAVDAAVKGLHQFAVGEYGGGDSVLHHHPLHGTAVGHLAFADAARYLARAEAPHGFAADDAQSVDGLRRLRGRFHRRGVEVKIRRGGSCSRFWSGVRSWSVKIKVGCRFRRRSGLLQRRTAFGTFIEFR